MMESLPNKVEAERALIGSVLNLGELSEGAQALDPDDMTNEVNRKIWVSLLKMNSNGTGIDVITLMAELDPDIKAHELGRMIAEVPRSANQDEYVRIVQQAAVQRQLAIATIELSKLAYTSDLTDTQIKTKAHEIIDARVEDLILGTHPWMASQITIADAYKERPPREYAIAGMIPVPSVTTFYGRPGGFKTMILMSGLIAIATGDVWLPGLPKDNIFKGFETTQYPTALIDMDNGRDTVLERVEAFGHGSDLPEDLPFKCYSMPAPRMDGSSADSMQLLENLIIESGARVVGIPFISM